MHMIVWLHLQPELQHSSFIVLVSDVNRDKSTALPYASDY